MSIKAALICGKFSTGLHGQIDAERLFEARALTGSESSFFNVARGLRELGHDVDVFCDVIKEVRECERLSGANVYHIDNNLSDKYDAYISLNEPDQFRRLPSNTKGIRIVQQQLNDFPYAMEGFDNFVDIYAFLAPVHRDHLLSVTPQITKEKAWWIPNSINLEISRKFAGIHKIPHSMAWCSSPDRGLHRLLEMWPLIRMRIPDATLKIFYRFDPWYEAFKHHNSKTGARARYIGECLSRLGRNGENGVTLVGPVPNVKLAEELSRTEILPYTCDCITFTEGFSVSIMDACAAGVVPIISDTDAIGDIYRNIAVVLPAKPGDHQERWVNEIAKICDDSNRNYRETIKQRCRVFADRFSRLDVAKLWENLISENIGRNKSQGMVFNHLPKSISEYATPIGSQSAVRESRDDDSPKSEIYNETKRREVATPHKTTTQRTRPLVSIIMPAYRPGGLDITFAGLHDQTFKDFEFILVDNRYEQRQKGVQEISRALDINTIHTPEHRKNGKWIVFCAAVNTAIALARGKYVFFLHDFTYVPPGWIEAHLALHEANAGSKNYVTGDNQHVDLPEVVFKRDYHHHIDMNEDNRSKTTIDEIFSGGYLDEICFFKNGHFNKSWLPLPIGPQQWQSGLTDMYKAGMQPNFQWPHLSNDSIEREFLLELNGLDERYDFCRSVADQNFAVRVEIAGGTIRWLDFPPVPLLNPRFLARTLPYGADLERIDGRWNTQDGKDYNQRVIDSKNPFADNPYNLRNLSVELEPWRNENAIRVPRDISDLAYWRRTVRPETPPLIIT